MTGLLEIGKTVLEIVAGSIGVSITVWKVWGKRKYNHYRNNRDQRWLSLAESMEKLDKKITSVHSQVFPDGGSSLNDKITTLGSSMYSLDASIAEIRQGQRTTRDAFDMINWESDRNGKVIYVSENLCDLLGCSESQILGNSWIGMVSNTDKARIIASWQLSVKNASKFKEEFSFTGSDGKSVKVKATALHIKNSDQELINSLVRFVPL